MEIGLGSLVYVWVGCQLARTNCVGSTINKNEIVNAGVSRSTGPAQLPLGSSLISPERPNENSMLTPQAQSSPVTPDQRTPAQNQCPYCDRSFNTKQGLGVHVRHAHPDEASERVNITRAKKVWSDEELRLMAREEALASKRGVRFINMHLENLVTGRTHDAIKSARRRQDYKLLVIAAGLDLDASSLSNSNVESFDNAPNTSRHVTLNRGPGSTESPPHNQHQIDTSSSVSWSDLYGDINRAISNLIDVANNIQGYQVETLVLAAQNCLAGVNASQSLHEWLLKVFPRTPSHRPVRTSGSVWRPAIPAWRKRRREYAKMQTLFRKNMSAAAKLALDGSFDMCVPKLDTMLEFWKPIFETPSATINNVDNRENHRRNTGSIWHPVTCEEVTAIKIPLSSAPGLDGITTRQWRSVPATLQALFFNTVMASGGFSTERLKSRTVFVPKKSNAEHPGDFRPISVASVVVRHLHKILALRLHEAGLVDDRQRCLDDGCAENIAMLASLLEDSRRNLRELHVASLDLAKAFDSVNHHAITDTLVRRGLSEEFVRYIERAYNNSSTVLEVDGDRSHTINVLRGVRQGDPLSSIIFALVVDDILAEVPREVGYTIEGTLVNAIAYADDLLIVTSTVSGMNITLSRVQARAELAGLTLNTSKCTALSIVPAGKEKKYKILSEPQFHLADGSYLKQLVASQEWRYLGIDLRPIGPKKASSDLVPMLDRLSKAPLKPQQRLQIVRCFMIPRYYHQLVLAGATLGKLKAMDKQVRQYVRKWLRLPPDTPVGFFHASISDGGLGLPSFNTTVPALVHSRLSSLAHSSSSAVRAIANSNWVSSRINWSERVLTRNGDFLNTKDKREKWWAEYLYRSNDGLELREAKRSSLSTSWVSYGSLAIPGRDYVQHIHVRINSLPTRIRTSRGIRRPETTVRCRAGCNVTETAAHVIQSCHRTHGGRIKRHNAVCKVLASGLRDIGYVVDEEPRVRTDSGLRKPDIIAVRDGRATVLDAQVVSGAMALNEAHERKRNYYASNNGIAADITSRHGVTKNCILYSTCTLSWRGIWSSKSADYLLSLGLSKRFLCGITTRVLQGSSMNWSRWNRMTNMCGYGENMWRRTGVG